MVAAGDAESAPSLNCVVDASVGIKLFLVEELSDRADALFAHLSDPLPVRFYVPDLFYIECTNILWKYVHRFGYPSAAALQDTADLVRLPMQVIPAAILAESALSLAVAYGITAYDAAYAALADQLSVPMVTADEALVRRVQDAPIDVRFLGDWPS